MGNWSEGGRMAARISGANIKKTFYYLQRNGIGKTWNAVRERLAAGKASPYVWIPPSKEELERQREQWRQEGLSASFSIIVPAYRTKKAYLQEMLRSVQRQSYPRWELILADASEDDGVEWAAASVQDSRIRYVRLDKNQGIAGNSNEALAFAAGEYVGLLDHDDLLTEDALYEMASAVSRGGREGRRPGMLYSDEDKCDQEGKRFFEPNLKEDFNLDLLLSNNYICHFLVMRRELMQSLGFRPEYDGAQDHDLALRAAGELLERGEAIGYVPKVLYHWRSHSASTAENPRSKLYAYEAGRRAIQDFAQARGWRASVEETAHVGFYALRYEGGVFCQRPDIGAVGGRVLRRGRTEGGRLTEEGEILYAGLPKGYSGYLHRAVLPQDAAAVDIRNIRVRQECRELFERVTGIPYRTVPGGERFDASLLPGDCDYVDMSLRLGRALREAGYRVLYLPEEER